MRFVNPIPFVADLPRSVEFYRDVIGLTVIEAHENFVRFEGGFALHDGPSLHEDVFGTAPPPSPFGQANMVLYFEADNLQTAFERVSHATDILHPIRTQSWGGRLFRAKDLDGHVIEIGERSA
ncbi:VOC family protein [Gymnodinialimonas sp. 2305UL16-5]|uniref:VOC family protein n=1 Tax=Gymnodinialimonas mytili TaxID=3126503 RepID=UPI0030B40FCA